MLEAYFAVVILSFAVILFVVGGVMLTETIVDIWETVSGKTLESILGLEEEFN